MRWLCATVGLLIVSLCLLGWIFLRDRDTSSWQPPEHQLAQVDANNVLNVLGGACPAGCPTRLLGLHRTKSHHWLMRITVSRKTQCLEINLDTFAVSQQRGLSGVKPSRCALHSSTG
jgi:hypothetical protein